MKSDQQPTPDPAPHFALTQLDAVKWLTHIPDESIDMMITDPAYESLEKHRALGTTTRLKMSKSSSNPWFPIFHNRRFQELFTQVFRVLRKNSHFYLFCDHDTAFTAKPVAENAGFKFWKPLVWDKKKIGMGYHYRARYELILFFEKGKRKLNDLSIPDVLEEPSIRGGYPTEKPVRLAEILIAQSSAPGEIIADPFMGSGTFGVAAVQQGRHFLGNDILDTAILRTRVRLTDVGGTEMPVLTNPT